MTIHCPPVPAIAPYARKLASSSLYATIAKLQPGSIASFASATYRDIRQVCDSLGYQNFRLNNTEGNWTVTRK